MKDIKKFYSISIDGPSASGKSTIAKILAKEINFIYIDTGAMYRAFTLACLNNSFDCKNEKLCCSLIGKITIGFNDLNHVTLNGKDVENEIRSNEVANNVSYIASYKDIRLELVRLQQALAKNNNVIMDGRDIGTYVLKDADVKFYQIADINERAKRRYLENITKGINSTYEECYENISKRDYIDSHRSFCPLTPADDSIEINTTNMSIWEVSRLMLSILKDRRIIK